MKLAVILVGIILLASVVMAGDKDVFDLKKSQLETIEARKGQIQAQSQLLQVTFQELLKQESILRDEIKSLEEKIKKSEPPKK